MLYKYVGMWKRVSTINPTSNMQHSRPFPARFPRAIHQKKEKRNSKKIPATWVRGINTCNKLVKCSRWSNCSVLRSTRPPINYNVGWSVGLLVGWSVVPASLIY